MKHTAINLTDGGSAAPKGFLEVILQRADTGEIVHQEESQNLVVNKGRSGMAHLWAGKWYPGDAEPAAQMAWVTTMKFGDRGHDPADPTLPLQTDVLRTQLFCEDVSRPPIISKPAVIDFPDGDEGTKVRFTVTIGAAEGNGEAGRQGYSEAGMYRADTFLAAHKTFGLITKTSEFILTFRWTFQF